MHFVVVKYRLQVNICSETLNAGNEIIQLTLLVVSGAAHSLSQVKWIKRSNCSLVMFTNLKISASVNVGS